MGNHTPSRYRREGRHAFDPQTDPQDVCPYRAGATFNSGSHRIWWFDGWEEARKAYDLEQAQRCTLNMKLNLVLAELKRQPNDYNVTELQTLLHDVGLRITEEE